MTLTNIIAALESAEEGSRELDARIAEATGHKIQIIRVPVGHPVFKEGGGLEFMFDPDAGERIGIPHYTTSLDCALKLVPEGFVPGFDKTLYTETGWIGRVWKFNPDIHGQGFIEEAIGRSPALALCIAALRAKEAGNE